MLSGAVVMGAGLAAGHRHRPVVVSRASVSVEVPVFMQPVAPAVAPAGVEVLLLVR